MEKVQLICQNTLNSGEITTVTLVLESKDNDISLKEAQDWLNQEVSKCYAHFYD